MAKLGSLVQCQVGHFLMVEGPVLIIPVGNKTKRSIFIHSRVKRMDLTLQSVGDNLVEIFSRRFQVIQDHGMNCCLLVLSCSLPQFHGFTIPDLARRQDPCSPT